MSFKLIVKLALQILELHRRVVLKSDTFQLEISDGSDAFEKLVLMNDHDFEQG